MSFQPPMPGDWNCPNCNDMQFARNPNCRKCGTAKCGPGGMAGDACGAAASTRGFVGSGASEANAQRRLKPGDWFCPGCNDLQFARNMSCRRCGGPKEGLPNHALGFGHGVDGIVVGERFGGTLAQLGNTVKQNAQPSDWYTCPSCSEYQFANNEACRKCGAANSLEAKRKERTP